MARVNNLENFLQDVADAIKTKKGSQTAIQAANFDTEIASITTGIMTKEEYDRCESICDVITGNSPLYTKIEYIESTGTQYIDTGLKGSNNTKITLRFCTIDFWCRCVYNRS